MADRTLDARSLQCPLPIIEAQRTLQGMQPGQTLEVLTTVPGSELDFEAFCRMTGHALLEHDETSGVYRFLLRHSG
jgi:tRNA 2-thiouridine synthesizing protein A